MCALKIQDCIKYNPKYRDGQSSIFYSIPMFIRPIISILGDSIIGQVQPQSPKTASVQSQMIGVILVCIEIRTKGQEHYIYNSLYFTINIHRGTFGNMYSKHTSLAKWS
ncbi:hypothetical protein CLU79DRAFT_761054 [Phycomyces nitens]|nr:hypothetical protein CLU79DRAFT_761054 [Phycomyces nitens]